MHGGQTSASRAFLQPSACTCLGGIFYYHLHLSRIIFLQLMAHYPQLKALVGAARYGCHIEMWQAPQLTLVSGEGTWLSSRPRVPGALVQSWIAKGCRSAALKMCRAASPRHILMVRYYVNICWPAGFVSGWPQGFGLLKRSGMLCTCRPLLGLCVGAVLGQGCILVPLWAACCRLLRLHNYHVDPFGDDIRMHSWLPGS